MAHTFPLHIFTLFSHEHYPREGTEKALKKKPFYSVVREDTKWAEYCPPQSKVQLVQKPSLTSDESEIKCNGGGQAIVCPGLPGIEGFPRIWNLKAKIRNVLKTSPCHWPAQWLDIQEEQTQSVVQANVLPGGSQRPRQLAQMPILPVFPFRSHVCLKPEPHLQSVVA